MPFQRSLFINAGFELASVHACTIRIRAKLTRGFTLEATFIEPCTVRASLFTETNRDLVPFCIAVVSSVVITKHGVVIGIATDFLNIAAMKQNGVFSDVVSRALRVNPTAYRCSMFGFGCTVILSNQHLSIDPSGVDLAREKPTNQGKENMAIFHSETNKKRRLKCLLWWTQ
ncbi:hypothetical protein DA097_01635 [Vibrio rotiferianus]|nr:hypothetical protein DA097_24390 [Vibrio rotiferianus]TMX73239.1 hypothetical protein DA097_01635 [Vibrio rotiferianus]